MEIHPPRFTLEFIEGVHGVYQHGYWYAYSQVTDSEGLGPDPLTAVSMLLTEIERAWPAQHV